MLLDTSTVIWAMVDPARLSEPALQALDEDADLLVSAATAWEIATKHRIGRLPGVGGLVDDWDDQLERFGLRQLDIGHRHALRAGSYGIDHADPFDRLIAAQAELEALPLVAKDRAYERFPVDRIW